MIVQIGYESYNFWGEYNGVKCNKTTALSLKISEDVKNYDVVITAIANKHDMLNAEVRENALNNQNCH